MQQESILEKIDKLNSFLEGACEGLTFLKDLLNSDEDSSPQAPVIPNAQKVDAYLTNTDNTYSQEAIALRTYQVFADSMAAYAKFLQEQWESMGDDIDKETLQQASAGYIANVLYDLHLLFETIHATKGNSSGVEQLISTFTFATWLMCSPESLYELYSVDFLEDVAELWEILTITVDDMNPTGAKSLFSQRLGTVYAQFTTLNERMISVLPRRRSAWSKNRAIKKYVKQIKNMSGELSNLLLLEAFYLRQRG